MRSCSVPSGPTPDQAASIGLVHEIVEPDQLLAAARRRADGLSAAPPDVYALAKHQLHGPARERIGAARPVDDPRVVEIWGSSAPARPCATTWRPCAGASQEQPALRPAGRRAGRPG